MWDTKTTLQNFIQFALIEQLGVSGFHWLQFNCNFLMMDKQIRKNWKDDEIKKKKISYLSSGNINGKINVTERTAANFSDKAVFLCNHEFGRPH